ncbi:alpha/beta hydrolase, partial [Mycobacterium arosiense ATCC BAA-1401 = DSM 45069]
MMARMPDLSRRALLGLGASAALGAAGAYGLDILLEPRTSHAAPTPTAGTRMPLAPPPGPPRDPAPPAA